MTDKPVAGAPFPRIDVPQLDGSILTLGQPLDGHDWQMVVVYRGKHCPKCHQYLQTLQNLRDRYHDLGIDVVTVSADPEPKARAMVEELGLTLPMGYDLFPRQMQQLGLYVSDPRSPQETDRPFAEPGLFVINGAGTLQLVDISNAPFARPDLDKLADGLEFIRAKDYPIRGTRAA